MIIYDIDKLLCVLWMNKWSWIFNYISKYDNFHFYLIVYHFYLIEDKKKIFEHQYNRLFLQSKITTRSQE